MSPIDHAFSGLQTNSAILTRVAQEIAQPGRLARPEDAAAMIQAKAGFKANAAMIRVQRDMEQTLLDILT